MKIAICEDIGAEALQLKTKIEKSSRLSFKPDEINIFSTGKELLQNGEFYDILFIDCKLPDMTGIELAHKIRETNNVSVIIFVTSYIEFAAEGYTVNALRYLMKPVSDKKLDEALEAYEAIIRNDCTVEITGMRNPIFTKSSEIMYIESLGRRTIVRLTNRSVDSLKSLETFGREIRSDFFFRTSRQFIVNMRHISRKEGNHIYMGNGEIVEISRRQLHEFDQRYRDYLTHED